jgi:hypothetical protein
MPYLRRLLLLSTLLLVASCGGGGASDEQVFGPCVVNYAEPILTIASVIDATSSAVVSTVALTDIAFNGASIDLSTLLAVSANVQLAGGVLQCTVPCALATEAGTYSATVSAAGYKSTNVSVAAQYQTFAGGCPASYGGGKHISVSLQSL